MSDRANTVFVSWCCLGTAITHFYSASYDASMGTVEDLASSVISVI